MNVKEWHSPSPGSGGSGTFPIARRGRVCKRHHEGRRPEGCLLQTRPSLAMGNVILSHSFYSYSKWKTKISHWKNGFSDPITLSVTALCFPAIRDLRWNCYICERMDKLSKKHVSNSKWCESEVCCRGSVVLDVKTVLRLLLRWLGYSKIRVLLEIIIFQEPQYW